MMSPMDITIGFADNTRELNIENVAGGEETKATISQKLAAGEGVIELTDGAGHEYLINADKVAYVRTGNSADRKVGFFA
ncbi:DUF3107 domain-containing protein [uncultured Corynebacterium sp.]|uniref:DUF3107 domain-containing protein n=1 Tax=uncultured Corynebacterium sp. TaxID=159447 RepID=UPI00261CB25A|nr:DUF3107 domain-containing protein [uncultured Corynebacterium sp.]